MNIFITLLLVAAVLALAALPIATRLRRRPIAIPESIVSKVDEIMARNRALYSGFTMKLEDDNDGTRLTHPQALARMKEIETELERLGELDDLTPEQELEFADLRETYKKLDLHRRQLERAADLAEIRSLATGVNGGTTVSGSRGSRADFDRDAVLEPDSIEDARFRNPWDLSEVRMFGRSEEEIGREFYARAECAVERMQGCSDNIREAAMSVLERADRPAVLARQMLLTSSPEYLRGWVKLAMGKQHALTAEEQRAMSLTDANGGYLVPFQLDPTVIVTSDGSYNEIRQVARQVIATGDVWNGVSAGAVAWSWDAEAAQVSDDAPTFAQPTVPVHKAQGFVPISIEAADDAANVTQEVGRLLAEGKEDLEAVAFATGTGSGQPTGIVTALAASSPSVVLAPATAETFAAADVYATQAGVPAKYRGRGSWLANNLIYNRIRQFDTAGGSAFWASLGDGRPEGLLGRRALEAEAMDGTFDPAATAAHNYLLIYGDFSNYVIADRVGTRVEFIPTLFGANQRPTGQRGWHAWYRVGADSVNDGAFRMLDIPTTA